MTKKGNASEDLTLKELIFGIFMCVVMGLFLWLGVSAIAVLSEEPTVIEVEKETIIHEVDFVETTNTMAFIEGSRIEFYIIDDNENYIKLRFTHYDYYNHETDQTEYRVKLYDAEVFMNGTNTVTFNIEKYTETSQDKEEFINKLYKDFDGMTVSEVYSLLD